MYVPSRKFVGHSQYVQLQEAERSRAVATWINLVNSGNFKSITAILCDCISEKIIWNQKNISSDNNVFAKLHSNCVSVIVQNLGNTK